MDYITCSYCGIVKRGHNCPFKSRYKRVKDTKGDRFRSTQVWAKKRLDNNNLITLCKYHHNLAEKGEIPRQELIELVEDKPPVPSE